MCIISEKQGYVILFLAKSQVNGIKPCDSELLMSVPFMPLGTPATCKMLYIRDVRTCFLPSAYVSTLKYGGISLI
jgi:hypothetical protein